MAKMVQLAQMACTGEALPDRALSGDARDLEGARRLRFAELVQTQRERALRLAWRLLGGDAAAAEDVVQEAFVRAYQGLSQLRGEASLEAWYQRILVNEVRRYQRWRAVRERWSGLWQSSVASLREPPERDRGLQRRISAALESLPRGQRECFVLVHMEGMSVAQAAALLGKSPGTIKSHLHRALHATRARLQDLREV